jgi:aspartate/methionine/tyrosine aminotransferase
MNDELLSLSTLAQRVALKPPLPYAKEVARSFMNLYDPITNPSGKIIMGVAENKLCLELLVERIKEACDAALSIPGVLNYTSPSGMPQFRSVLANFMSEYLFGGLEVNPNHLILSSGCVGLLVSLSLLLFEPGDAVLIPTPYYPAFDQDFLILGHVTVVGIDTVSREGNDLTKIFSKVTCESLQQAYDKAISLVHKPKAILLTQPSNPTGTIYSSEELQTIIEWTLKTSQLNGEKMHIISDEVYALSLHQYPEEQLPSDTSIRQVAEEMIINNQLSIEDYRRIHILWSLSKDFAGSGLRVGVMYTQNDSLLQAIQRTNDAMMVSNITQAIFLQILSDRSFVNFYLLENRRQLAKSYLHLQTTLESELIVQVISAQAGIFAYVNFNHYLAVPKDYQAETVFWSQLNEEASVLVTPGYDCHCILPGCFRICFAFVSFEVLSEGLLRIIRMCKSIEQSDKLSIV